MGTVSGREKQEGRPARKATPGAWAGQRHLHMSLFQSVTWISAPNEPLRKVPPGIRVCGTLLSGLHFLADPSMKLRPS